MKQGDHQRQAPDEATDPATSAEGAAAAEAGTPNSTSASPKSLSTRLSSEGRARARTRPNVPFPDSATKPVSRQCGRASTRKNKGEDDDPAFRL